MTHLETELSTRKNTQPHDGAQAIGRALMVLKSFLRVEAELGIAQITRITGLTPSTAHRIVRALVQDGFLEQNVQSERYYLGRTTVLLGQVAERNLGFNLVFPFLEELVATTGEGANLVIRDTDNEAVVILRKESPHPLRMEQPPGTRLPLYCTASGKSLLAFSSDLEKDLVALGSLERFTDTTITRIEDLKRELTITRERGYSIDNEERIPGVRCVGAPIRDKSGHAHAAIAVQIPITRIPENGLDDIVPLVLNSASQIENIVAEPPKSLRQ